MTSVIFFAKQQPLNLHYVYCQIGGYDNKFFKALAKVRAFFLPLLQHTSVCLLYYDDCHIFLQLSSPYICITFIVRSGGMTINFSEALA